MADKRAVDDAELVRQAQQGSLDAFTGLCERYLPAVYNRVRYVVPEQDVEDVTQEVFVALMKSLRSFRGDARFSTWLRTLTNRRIADYYRKRGREGTQLDVDLSEVNPGLSPDFRAEADTVTIDDRVMLRQALRALPERHREILLLRFAEGLQFNEIARLQGQSLEATKSLFRRAVVALRRQVGEDND
jgi:RNA polymerase sigma-70 factor (ECF subfamily)